MLESLAGLLLFAWGACRFIALCMGCLKYEHMVAILGITITRAPKKALYFTCLLASRPLLRATTCTSGFLIPAPDDKVGLGLASLPSFDRFQRRLFAGPNHRQAVPGCTMRPE